VASQHRGVEGCRLDFTASIAEENPQRDLGRGRWEFAYYAIGTRQISHLGMVTTGGG
jgi:hypothetical protein